MKTSIHPSDALPLILAGKALITLESPKTGTHFTYRIRKCASKEDLFFCSVLTGPDNYSYMGIISGREFRTTAKSRISPTAKSVLAFSYTLHKLFRGEPTSVNIYPNGKCCRCGRTLTTPESIQAGIGPECIKHL